MERPYLIDTNVLIDYLGGEFSGPAETRLDVIFSGAFQYSIISRMEFLGFKKASENDVEEYSLFLDTGRPFFVDTQISDMVVEISRKITKKNLPDLIITATALVCESTLLTRNIADFKNVPGIVIENPHDWV